MSSLALTSGWYYICTSYYTSDKLLQTNLLGSDKTKKGKFISGIWLVPEA